MLGEKRSKNFFYTLWCTFEVFWRFGDLLLYGDGDTDLIDSHHVVWDKLSIYQHIPTLQHQVISMYMNNFCYSSLSVSVMIPTLDLLPWH